MPFLRFARVRRGYVSTFLMHTFGSGRQARSQLLYWFRSPPSVQVGRPAIDAEAIAAIESAYPDIEFDWGALLSQRPPPPDAEKERPPRGGGEAVVGETANAA